MASSLRKSSGASAKGGNKVQFRGTSRGTAQAETTGRSRIQPTHRGITTGVKGTVINGQFVTGPDFHTRSEMRRWNYD